MADVSTPPGETPALDDGNRSRMYNTPLLCWSSGYGDATIGRKFLTIENKLPAQSGSGYTRYRSTFLLIELAIPRITSGAVALTDRMGSSSSPTDQQLVIRRSLSGKEHYVLLNGEFGDAISHGEGHEQPDNMQLLWQAGNTSFLIDSGYDYPYIDYPAAWTILGASVGSIATAAISAALFNDFSWNRSSWNNYKDHNVLWWVNGHGGIPYPDLSLLQLEINSKHDGITSLYGTASGNISVLHGEQRLKMQMDNGQETFGYYGRDVIFVDGSAPYLIDLNKINHTYSAYKQVKFTMSYHANSNSFTNNSYNVSDGSFMKWNNVSANENLWVQPVSMEYGLYNNASWRSMLASSDQVGETGSSPTNIQRLDIADWLGTEYTLATIFQPKLTSETTPNKIYKLWVYTGVGGSSPTGTKNTHQGWVQQVATSTYDVFVARSKAPHTWSSLLFNLNQANASFPDLRISLPSDKEFGFARVYLNSSSGRYEIQQGYQLNFKGPIYYTANTTESAAKTWNGDVYISDGIVVTIQNILTISPDTRIFLGTNAQVVLSGVSAKILADGGTDTSKPIRFRRLGTSAWRDVTLGGGGGNVFKNVVFEGGTNTVDVRSTTNTFTNVRFKNGVRGISSDFVSTNVRSGFTLDNCVVEGNSSVGVYAANTAPTIKRSTIQNNGEAGIYFLNASPGPFHRNLISGNGTVAGTRSGIEVYTTYLDTDSDIAPTNVGYNRIINNVFHEIYVASSGNVYLGYSTGFPGKNSVFDAVGPKASGEYLIYNASSNTITAQNTYWQGQNLAANFFGPNDFSVPLSSDEALAQGVGATNVPNRAAPDDSSRVTVDDSIVLNTGKTEVLATASTTEVYSDSVASAKSFDDLKKRMQELRNQLSSNYKADDTAGMIRELFFLSRLDRDDKLGEKRANESAIEFFIDELGTADTKPGLTQKERKVLKESGETAVQLVIQGAIWDDQYTEANSYVDTYGKLVTTKEIARTLLLNRVTLFEQQQRYSEALALFEQFKLIISDDASRPDYTPENFDLYEASLREKVGKSKNEYSSGQNDSNEAVVQESSNDFGLGSAFPNPFNPSTVIPYTVSAETRVKIEVYDVLGRRVALLIDGVFRTGTHQATFDAGALPSGMYLVRAQFENASRGLEIRTQKLTLQK